MTAQKQKLTAEGGCATHFNTKFKKTKLKIKQ